MIEQVIDQWHRFASGESDDLDSFLAEDVTFYSPIVYTPQEGKAVTAMYLQAARHTLAGDGGERRFRYTKQVLAHDTAVLEFETTLDGKYVNGVDIIRANDAGQIVEFRVMIRPLQAVNLVHARMRAMIEAAQ